MDFGANLLDYKGASSHKIALWKDLVEMKVRVTWHQWLLNILEDSIIETWIELHYEGIITETKVELLLILEEKAEMGKDKELFFVLLARAYYFIQGHNQLPSVVSPWDYELSDDRHESPLRQQCFLVLKENSVDSCGHCRKAKLLTILANKWNLRNASNNSNMPSVLIEIDASICINASLKIIRGSKKSNVLVVLLNHQFLDLLLLS